MGAVPSETPARSRILNAGHNISKSWNVFNGSSSDLLLPQNAAIWQCSAASEPVAVTQLTQPFLFVSTKMFISEDLIQSALRILQCWTSWLQQISGKGRNVCWAKYEDLLAKCYISEPLNPDTADWWLRFLRKRPAFSDLNWLHCHICCAAQSIC